MAPRKPRSPRSSVYAHPIFRPDDDWNVLQDFREAPRFHTAQAAILDCAADLNLTWTFRRSAGQSPLTTLSYGLIAATLADLTGGLIRSDDGGWDYARYPATGAEMLVWYFQPDHALSPATADWSQRCINLIRQSGTGTA